MAWENTYSHNVLIGLDQLGAAIFFNRNDLTISSLCGLVLLDDRWIAILKLSSWQVKTLKVLGRVLNWIQANHCPNAILGDQARANFTLMTLQGE